MKLSTLEERMDAMKPLLVKHGLPGDEWQAFIDRKASEHEVAAWLICKVGDGALRGWTLDFANVWFHGMPPPA